MQSDLGQLELDYSWRARALEAYHALMEKKKHGRMEPGDEAQLLAVERSLGQETMPFLEVPKP